MELDILTQALRLRARGLAVFPVDVATKTPLVEWGGFDAALPTEDEIRAWFDGGYHNSKKCKPDCNQHAIGVAMGPISDALLLDFDFKHPEAKEFYEKNRHRFPRTWKEITASGGLHLYFRWCDALDGKQTNTTSKLFRGVDTKGYGGYSKITPSPGYKWLIPPHLAPLAQCPQWLIDALPNREKREIADAFIRKPDDWMIRELENVNPADPVNGRTPTFIRAIGRLKAKTLGQAEILALLTPYAEKYQYTKLASLIEDQFQRYPPRVDQTVSPILTNHSFKAAKQNKKPIPFLVGDIIHEKAICVLAGLQESRKSWLMVDLALSLASGTKWLGKYDCKRSRVLIIDQEREIDEMMRRADAIAKARGVIDDVLEGWLIPKASIQPPFRLNVDPSYTQFEKLIEETRPNVLLIDSLKAIQSGDINSSNDMQRVFERLKALRLKYGLTIVILHHENKGRYEAIREKQVVTAEKIEGSGVINQVPEEIFIAVPYDGESSFFHHVKNSFGVKVPPFLVKVRDVKPDKSEIAVEAF